MAEFAGSDNLTFGIRIDRSKIPGDMAAARAQITSEVAKTKAGVEKAGGYTPISFAEVKAETNAKWAALRAELFGTAEASGKATKEIEATSAGLDKLAGKSKGIDNLATSMYKFAAAILIAEAAGRALGAVVDVIEGEASAKSVVEGIPVVGNLGKNLGRLQDKIPVVRGPRNAVANYFGKQTDTEIKEFDKQQAELKKTLDANEPLIRQGAQQQREAAAVTQAAQREAARAGKSSTQVAVMTAQERLDDFKKRLADRPVSGKGPSADEKEAVAALKENVRSAQSANASAAFEKLGSGFQTAIGFGDKLFTVLKTKTEGLIEARIRGDAEATALELENQGKVDEAERVKLNESIRRRIEANEEGIERIAVAERAALAKAQEERQAADIDRSTDEHARMMHAIADEEKQRNRAAEIVPFLKPERAQVAEVMSAQAAGMLNLMGGDSKQDKLTSVQQQALLVLEKIHKKIGPATTSP